MFFLQREVESLSEVSIGGRAVFYQEIVSADAKRHTRGVELAVPHGDVVVIKACNGVVSRVQIAFFYQDVITGADVDPVKAAVNGYVFEGVAIAI